MTTVLRLVLAALLLAPGVRAEAQNLVGVIAGQVTDSQDRALPGDEVELIISIHNDKLLPLAWLQAEDFVSEGTRLRGSHLERSDRPGLDVLRTLAPAQRGDTEQIYFGATVTYATRTGAEHTISIVGMDEVDAGRGRVSWISPIAKVLLRKQPGDTLRLGTPGGIEEIEVIDVRYEPLP